MSAWLMLKLIPKNALSRAVGWLAGLRLPEFFRLRLLKWFSRRYRLNLSEAELPLESYPTLNALFTRKLKPMARPLEADWVHPADATLTAFEEISSSLQATQAKGFSYSIEELLGESAEPWVGGRIATYYLCPTDYHRVHFPCSGRVTRARVIPGHLWPVNAFSVARVPRLFAVNERVVTFLETAVGLVAVVMVGATNVGQISVGFDASIRTNLRAVRRPQSYFYGERGHDVRVGQELGVFHLGSTVIVCWPRGLLDLVPGGGRTQGVLPRSVKVGERLWPEAFAANPLDIR